MISYGRSFPLFSISWILTYLITFIPIDDTHSISIYSFKHISSYFGCKYKKKLILPEIQGSSNFLFGLTAQCFCCSEILSRAVSPACVLLPCATVVATKEIARLKNEESQGLIHEKLVNQAGVPT